MILIHREGRIVYWMREAFRLEATLRAFAGDEEVCRRDWDRILKRDLV